MDIFKTLNDYAGFLTLIGILVALIVGMITIWGTIIRRKLSCQLISLNQVISVKDSSLDEKLKVIYDGNEIKNPVLIEIKLKNQGNKPITENSFKTDLKIDFLNKLEIFKSECIFEESEQYHIDPIKINNNRAIILPKFSLNPKKSITLKIVGSLLQNVEEDDIKIDAHIVGVELKKLKSIETTKKSEIKIYYVINLIPIIIFIVILVFLSISLKYKGLGQNIASSAIIILLFSAPICSLTSLEFMWKKTKGR